MKKFLNGITKHYQHISKADWQYYGRELIAAGYLSLNMEKFRTIEVTPLGMQFLQAKDPLSLKAPHVSAKLNVDKRKERKQKLGEQEYDEHIFGLLRSWRSQVAREKGIPAYMVFGDATLQTIAREVPRSMSQLSMVHGIGEKKLDQYGEEILKLFN